VRSASKDIAAQLRHVLNDGGAGQVFIDGQYYKVSLSVDYDPFGIGPGAGLNDEQFREATGLDPTDVELDILLDEEARLCPSCDLDEP
jgi:hypothetical protein